MFNSIVVGTDGSANAETAVRVAAEMAALSPGTSVNVVAAYKPLSAWELNSIAADLPEEFRSLLHAHAGADSILASARSIVRSAGAKADFAEVNADPVDALLSAVETHDADLIVVGSRGEGIARRAIHGSVSTRVLHHAPCTVLVVKGES